VTQVTGRPPVRARSGRRPLPPLLFLLVLALAAAGVWWNVLRQHEAQSADKAEACATAQQAPPSLDPTTLSVRVLNATDRGGLAQQVAAELQNRGFTVAEIGNDDTDREVTGPGEVRHGPRGADAAAFLALLLPGAGDYPDTRATTQVDLVLGPDFVFPDSLASPDEVAAALSTATSAAAAC
jgi:LytR cell envelope-related transcriptional attenuator